MASAELFARSHTLGGTVPVMLLFSTRNVSSLSNEPSVDGSTPVKRLFWSSAVANLEQSPISSGMELLNWLSFTSKSVRVVIRPTVVGIGPVKAFPLIYSWDILLNDSNISGGTWPDNWLSRRPSFVNIPHMPRSDVGIVPLISFPPSSILVRDVNKPNSVGRVPLNWQFFQSNRATFVSIPTSVGTVPVKLLVSTWRLVISVNRPISVGIEPLNWLKSRNASDSLVIAPRSVLIVPRSLFLKRMRDVILVQPANNPAGRSPLKSFCAKSNNPRLVRSLRRGGSGPVNWLVDNNNRSISRKFATSVGIDPVSKLDFNHKISRLVINPSSLGIVPVNMLSSKSQSHSLVS
mmetsp:Transcript_2695/g.6047  ORF Transcript_2695/g.6047 Transcript_2695/m.6047 type:complete len:349 (-) Transcript_2695:1751-2797(-)